MPRIRRLDVQGFRGIRQRNSLLFDGKSILLFGENGTGKSSFVDAIEKLLTGKVSMLDGRGLGLSSDRQGPHILDGQYPTQVAIVFDDKLSTTLELSTVTGKLPASALAYVEAGSQNLFILRRQQLLNFIESQPKERYDLLRPFLPLGHIEEVEKTLEAAAEMSGVEMQTSAQEVARIARDIRRLLEIPVSQPLSLAHITEIANRRLTKISLPNIGSLEELPTAKKGISKALSSFGDLTFQSSLNNAVQSLEELLESLAQIEIEPFLKSVERLREREAKEARVFYEAVLEQGLRWISDERRTTCPLCEQPIVPKQLESRVNERLSSFREILASRREVAGRLVNLQSSVKSAVEAVTRAKRRVETLADEGRRKNIQSALEATDRALTSLSKGLDRELKHLEVDSLRMLAAMVHERSSFVESLKLHLAQMRSTLSSLPSASAALELLDLNERFDRLGELLPKLQEAQALAKQAEDRANVARRVFEKIQTARKEEVQAVLSELSQDIESMYTRLHPGESHGGVQLAVREAVPESVNLRSSFYGRDDEDPRAYYSDAHLDTLGLSIFLALRKWYRRQRPEFDLMILDDVLTSVDSAHSVRLAELLLKEFQEYQILLTTHDRIWFEHLRDIQARCRVAQNFVNKIIHKWTLEEGPDLREPEDERESLDRLMDDGSAEEIAVMAGRLLEHLLQEMRYALRLSVKAKRGEQYEIGELWPALYATIKDDYPVLYQKVKSALDTLDVRWPIRNWIGAHWNTWARNVSRTAAIEFAKSVAELFDHVFCTICRRFITPSATPIGQLACSCGDLIYPAPGKQAVKPGGRESTIQATRGALRDAQLDTSRYFERERKEAGGER